MIWKMKSRPLGNILPGQFVACIMLMSGVAMISKWS